MKAENISAQMKKAGILQEDLEETFSRSSGPGGQHVNKVSSAVTLRHRPSGLVVTVQDSRSQSANRQLARERLLKAVLTRTAAERAARRAERAQERRRKSPRPPKLQEQILQRKRKRAQLKRDRGRISE